jgi:uncharacterized membrane protein
VNQQQGSHAEQAIESIAELDRRAQAELSPHQRTIERFTRGVARPATVYLVLAAIVLWIGANLMLASRHAAWDPPPFQLLQGLVSLSALLMTILILTTENRIAQMDQLRDRLELQINLLTERKVAKLIDMLDAIRRDLPSVPTHDDPEVDELRTHTNPHDVARALEEAVGEPD